MLNRFWSNIIFDAGCMESLVSFLQEASPFYFPFQHESEKVSEAYFTAYQRVLQIFCRIITNKENEVINIFVFHTLLLAYYIN